MLHYLGVDHIGHLQGFNSDLFPVKLNEMDDVFRSIFDSVTFSAQTQNESYLFLVTGDHGMTKSGNHGGSTRDETHTALIFVSNNKSHNFPSGYSKVPPLKERTFLQIDIAPTIAALFNFPTPAKSQGRIISP
ncbi:GPI ethanolamine phosphate transferase 2, partial [Golovinomyces cichoracearum]